MHVVYAQLSLFPVGLLEYKTYSLEPID